MKIDDFLGHASWFDWAIGFMIFVSTIMSLRRGFFREAISLLSWVAAFIVARQFHQNVDFLLEEHVTDDFFRSVSSFFLLFLGTLICGALLGYIFSSLLNFTGLSSTDRLMGMVFGFARGALIVTIIVFLIGLTPLRQDEWYGESIFASHFEMVAKWALDRIEKKDLEQIVLPNI